MGIYLNSSSSYSKYQETVANPFFVDKSALLEELSALIGSDSKYICITRPRRFGKTVMANMIASFFTRSVDSTHIFDRLKIAESEEYRKHLNRYNVIFVDFSWMASGVTTYEAYIDNLKTLIREDLHISYPDIGFRQEGDIAEDLERIRMATEEKFIFILDEWDTVFHMPFTTENDHQKYLLFLKGLLKDRAYVALTYMTGVLPISKYSSGSELNMFDEYKISTMERYSEYFGFTESEVDIIYKKYLERKKNPKVSRADLRLWYDGYHTARGERMYNPRSVGCALKNNQLSNYWTSSGPYDEIFYYIQNNIEDVRNDLALMVAGERVEAKVQEYAATSTELATKNQIYSAMVVYGLLTYEEGEVFIPNKELMGKFEELLQEKSSLGYVHRLAKASNDMLKATLAGDTETMARILKLAHDTETPILSYNKEVDFIFYPIKAGADCIILELKIDHKPEEAIQQIKDRQYALRFKGKLGEVPKYSGRILAVGISYSKETKKHECKIEVLD